MGSFLNRPGEAWRGKGFKTELFSGLYLKEGKGTGEALWPF